MKVKEYMIDDIEKDILYMDSRFKGFADNFGVRKYVKPHADRVEAEEYAKAYRIKRQKMRLGRSRLINALRNPLESEFWQKRKEGDEITAVLVESDTDKVELVQKLNRLEKRCDRIAFLIWDKIDFNPCPPYASHPCCACTGFYRAMYGRARNFSICNEEDEGALRCINHAVGKEDRDDGRTHCIEMLGDRKEYEFKQKGGK